MKKLTIKKLSNYLGKIVDHNIQSSLMIWGAPGIGKSSVIDSVAKKVADGLGTGFDATIGKLVEMFYEQQTKRRKTEKGREEDIFEAEVLEND